MQFYLKPALILFLLMSLLTGLAYPLLITGLAQLIFPDQAKGSLMRDKEGQLIGSSLIGQAFQSPAYFWGRPSATQPFPYNAAASGGSNLGPLNPVLIDVVAQRSKLLSENSGRENQKIPVDLVSASASGLDPHISPAAAAYQISRIAKSRQLPEAEIQRLADKFTEDRTFGVLGETRVNVLLLNLALDEFNTHWKQAHAN